MYRLPFLNHRPLCRSHLVFYDKTALGSLARNISTLMKCQRLNGLESFFSTQRSLTTRQFSSTACVLGRMRQAYIANGQWKEMEPMNVYLVEALEKCRKFVATVSLKGDEENQFRVIKSWHKNDYTPQKTTLLPFIKLEAIGPTFEGRGGDYLSQNEIDFYLKEGLLGPIPIPNLTQCHLQTIKERFQNFNKDYFRNLGSLYTALSHRCLFDLATNSHMLAKVSSILGHNIMLSNMTVHEIGVNSGKSSEETSGMVDAFNCHSDLSSGSHYYFRPGANQVEGLALDNRGVCVWVSITGTDANNSPLYLFPKTHLWEITTPFTHIERAKNQPKILEHVLKLLAFNHRNPARRMGLCNMEYEYLLNSEVSSQLSKIRRTEVYTQPGDAIFFNQHTRHGSGINLSSRARLAISLRFNTALKEVGGTEEAGAIVSQKERELLGLSGETRKPIVQLLGDKHHPNNVPIDLERLRKEAK